MIVADISIGFYSILLKVVIVDDETTRGGTKVNPIKSREREQARLAPR